MFLGVALASVLGVGLIPEGLLARTSETMPTLERVAMMVWVFGTAIAPHEDNRLRTWYLVDCPGTDSMLSLGGRWSR